MPSPAPPKQDVFGNMVPWAEPQWYRGLPSPYYKDSHRKLRKAIREWNEEHLMDVAFDWEENKQIDPKVYEQMGKDGLLVALAFGRKVPAKWAKPDGTVFGGVKADEWDGFHDMILISELVRNGSLGSNQGLTGGMQIGLPPVYHFGSQELQDRILPDVLAGRKRICLAITEPEAGSDVKNLSCEAVRSADGKHYIVNGTKKWITNGVYSDYFTTAVRTKGKAGDAGGISFLLIPKTEGVTCRRMIMSGQWCSGTTLLSFDNVKVPVENLIGQENQGFRMIMTNFNHERLMIIYIAQQLARICIEDALKHAHERKVFGKPLIESDLIKMKFANMARMVDSQQTWIESIVYQIENMSHEEANLKLGGTTALLKAHCSMVLEDVARDAVQVLGGIAHTRGGKGERIERIRRDVKGVAIPGGSEEIMSLFAVKQECKVAIGLGAKL
ncbi:hypothetical protein OIV83_001976 [Microbotryomycetes sp. JL201]|nr:hypothetical protein OIV83_001976 [Microbotryomycetes sp. JL201]